MAKDCKKLLHTQIYNSYGRRKTFSLFRLISGFQTGAVLALCILLTSCQGGDVSDGGSGVENFSFGTLQPQTLGPYFGNSTGEKIKIALLLPFSNTDPKVREIAKSLKDAAELALFDVNNTSIELIQKDTRGTAAGARFAAETAINEGAELILGPLIAQSVSSAGQVAKQSDVPVIAFSSTESVARNGIYLLSFLPSIEVRRIIDFSISRGLKRFAALVPARPYGNLIAGDITRITEERGGMLFTVERFSSKAGSLDRSVTKINQLSEEIDALMIADGYPILRLAAQDLGYPGNFQLIGTGLWHDPRITSEPGLYGAWFPGPEPGTRRAFERRFSSTYGRTPTRLASLGYDAVSLSATLARAPVGLRFTPEQLTNPKGFHGVDGQYRFHSDGRIERGLAVLQVSAGGFQVIDPSPKNFSGTNF